MLKLQTTNGSFCKEHGLLRIAAAHVYLLNVGMVADVILAIAVIAIAFGAITELQIRIGYIRAATNSAFVMIRCFHLCSTGLEGTGIGERDGAGATIRLLGSIILFLPYITRGEVIAMYVTLTELLMILTLLITFAKFLLEFFNDEK